MLLLSEAVLKEKQKKNEADGTAKKVRLGYFSGSATHLDDIEMIDITYEDGTSCSCEVIAHFDVEDISYAALLPEGDEDSDILVYRYSENGDDVELCEITDEDEFNKVADVLDEILDDLEFNSED